MTQKLKLLYIMKIFLEETDETHGITVPEIISRMSDLGADIDRRTVYDNIETLQLFGFDITAKRGKTYTYCLASRQFELAELKLLVDAVQSSKFITHQKTTKLIKKLERLTSIAHARHLDRQVYIHNRVKTMNDSIYSNIDTIHTAIAENKKISFIYYEYSVSKQLIPKRNGEKYIVSPYMLIWDDENYYLVAYHERYGSLAHFRVDKMGKLAVYDELRENIPENADPSEYAKNVFGMFPGEKTAVSIAFSKSLIGVFIDRFGKDITITKHEDDMLRARVHVAVSPVFFAWLSQFGKNAKILYPDDIAKKMQEHLMSCMSVYDI